MSTCYEAQKTTEPPLRHFPWYWPMPGVKNSRPEDTAGGVYRQLAAPGKTSDPFTCRAYTEKSLWGCSGEGIRKNRR